MRPGPVPAETAEQVISNLAFSVQEVERLPDATPDQVHRLRLLVQQLDGVVVRKWRA